MSEPTAEAVIEKARKAWPDQEWRVYRMTVFSSGGRMDEIYKLSYVAGEVSSIVRESARTLGELYDKIAADPPPT